MDYALFLGATPRLFVEAKGLGENLGDDKWARQILGYASVAGVAWVVLTDGNEYRIYNSHAAVPVEQKLFRRVVIASPDPNAGETLALLSKTQLQDDRIEVLWRADFVDRQVRVAVESLFSSDVPADFARLIRKRVPALAVRDGRANLGRARVTIDHRTAQQAAIPPPTLPPDKRLDALALPGQRRAPRARGRASPAAATTAVGGAFRHGPASPINHRHPGLRWQQMSARPTAKFQP